MTSKLSYFDVKVEVLVPAVITHRVLAESPEAALEKVEKENLTILDVKYSLAKLKKTLISIYDAGTYNLHYRKKL